MCEAVAGISLIAIIQKSDYYNPENGLLSNAISGFWLHKSTQRTMHTSTLGSKSTKKGGTTAFYTLAASITCSFDR